MSFVYYYILLLVALLFASCEPEKPIEKKSENNIPATKTTPVINYSLVNTLPHDSTCFTEGFLFHNGELFESSGAPDHIPYTRSMFGVVDQKNGRITVKGELDRNKYFGEGIVVLKDKLYQLTWQGQTGFIYDVKTFKNIGTFNYMSKEGWGLTTDGKDLIMSDGTNVLTFLNPDNFQITKTLLVSENNYAADYLNELEYINGFIYANVWMTNFIVKIDPETGNILGKMDLADIAADAKKKNPSSLEMNGIAFDSISKKILVTGKMWNNIYEIKIPL